MKSLLSLSKKTLATCGYFYRFACREMRSYPMIIFLSILLPTLLPFLTMILPKMIIEELTGAGDVQRLIILTAILVGGGFLLKNLILLVQELRKVQEDRIARRLELAMSRKAMTIKYECTETEAALSARQKAETGMSWYSGGIRGMSECLVKIGTGIFVGLGVILLVVRTSPVLLVISLISVLINAVCTSGINRAAQEVFEKTPAINKFYSYIYTRINGREFAKELRLYNAFSLIETKAVNNAKELNQMDNECARKQFGWGLLGSTVSTVGYGVSYAYLAIMVLRGRITIAEFVMCITAMEVFTNDCLIAVITNLQQLVMKSNFMSAFVEYMGLEDAEEIAFADKQKGADLNPETTSVRENGVHETPAYDAFDGIEFDHVSFKYPGTDEYILKDINLKIGRGESISLVGKNGSGKTTLVKLLCRLYDVSEGSIRLCGRDISEYSYEAYVKLLSVVFQDFKLFGYSLEENVRLGNTSKTDPTDEAFELSGISDWVESLPEKGNTLLYKEYDEKGVEPSGGQAQKLAIARAVYRDSPVVILDEPTASLDPVAEYEIYRHFNDLIRNKTALYISHRLSSCKFCDRIVVLDDHTIKENGSHEELIRLDGIYAEMFASQAKWYQE
ncbi:MAG: ABC transporter ATP-binding protein [Lachnospiraceae bacterium]|nr:ABC transporter ATP-binding protein [Lachnospiraceae bacterium]